MTTVKALKQSRREGWLEMHPIGTPGYDPAEQRAVVKAFGGYVPSAPGNLLEASESQKVSECERQ